MKLSYKYPQIGIGNFVSGYYLGDIICDEDVRRMLSIPEQMHMGMGDVSLFITPKKFPNVAPWESQPSYPTQTSYESGYGITQFP